MAETSATEKLRRLLDERGVEWTYGDGTVSFADNGRWYHAWAYSDGAMCVSMGYLTPEQAIAATLESGTLTAEQVHDAIFNGSSYASFDGAKYYADGIRMQAIADELNAALGRGECEYVIEDNMNETEGMGDVWFRCTNCDMTYDYYADDWLMKQSYCPHCGCKIRKAVKR